MWNEGTQYCNEETMRKQSFGWKIGFDHGLGQVFTLSFYFTINYIIFALFSHRPSMQHVFNTLPTSITQNFWKYWCGISSWIQFDIEDLWIWKCRKISGDFSEPFSTAKVINFLSTLQAKNIFEVAILLGKEIWISRASQYQVRKETREENPFCMENYVSKNEYSWKKNL